MAYRCLIFIAEKNFLNCYDVINIFPIYIYVADWLITFCFVQFLLYDWVPHIRLDSEYQGWELTHFAQIKWATVSDSLRSLKKNNGPWANRSGHWEEMSDCERIAQVAQDKWATKSDSLRLLRGNERMSKWAMSKKIWLKNLKSCFSMSYIQFKKKLFWKNERIAYFCSFPLFWWGMWVNRSFRSNQMSNVSKSLRSLTKNEQPWAIHSHRSEEMSDRERIAQVAHQKWANEWIAHFFEPIAHLLIFGQKTRDSLGNQMSEFPALHSALFFLHTHLTHSSIFHNHSP